MSIIEAANQRPKGPGISIRGADWDNTEEMCKMLGPFAEAVELIEGDKYITLIYIPCLTEGLNAAILDTTQALEAPTVSAESSRANPKKKRKHELLLGHMNRARDRGGSGPGQGGGSAAAPAHQHGFPYLARLAVVHLAIPATSATSERVFSAAGNTVTKKRNRL
ncbi:unnamed protein product, partial [Discosporangium mesarthrocarpum]